LLKTLIAGGAGMIGSHLCQAMLQDGHEVVCLDNLSTGRAANLAEFIRHPRFTFIQHDVTRELPDVGRVDRVYHLASPASPIGYQRLPVETMLANSVGTQRLIERALASGGRFLFASTSEIYGDPLQHPQTEDYRGNVSSIGPRSTYDESKRFGEALTMAFVRTHGLDGRIVRIFNTFGTRADPEDGRVVVNFVTQALRHAPMTLYGDGQQTRSLCWVADLVEGLRLAMETDRTRGEVINLGNPREHTVMEIAQMVRSLVGSSSPFVFGPPAVGDDPRLRRPDISKAIALLGWQPRTPIEHGLSEVIREMTVSLNGEVAAQRRGVATNGHVTPVPVHPRVLAPRMIDSPPPPQG
jgi:nucleoside-diphosphate-sugar epimerase